MTRTLASVVAVSCVVAGARLLAAQSSPPAGPWRYITE